MISNKKSLILLTLFLLITINIVQGAAPIFPKKDIYQKYPGISKKYMNAKGKIILPDSVRILIIPVQFLEDNHPGTTGNGRFGSVTQPAEYSDYPIGRGFFYILTQYAKQYYDAAAYGKAKFILQDSLYNTTEVITLNKTMDYYGNDENWGTREMELFRDAVYAVDSNIDFSKFDEVFLFHAGCGQEGDLNGDTPFDIWSVAFYPELFGEYLDLPDGIPTNDTDELGNPVFVNSGLVVPESEQQDGLEDFSTLGVIVHEFGHILGAPDLYNTGDNKSSGIGSFGLMGAGEYNGRGKAPAFFSAWTKEFFNLCPVYEIGLNKGDKILKPNEKITVDIHLSEQDTPPELIKIWINENEYFLLENRQRDANFNGIFDFDDKNGDGALEFGVDSYENAEFDFTLPGIQNGDNSVDGSGILIWHIDKKIMDTIGIINTNAAQIYVNRKGVDLEEADGIQDLDGFAFTLEPALGSRFDTFKKPGIVETDLGSAAVEGNFLFNSSTNPNTANNGGGKTFLNIEILSLPDSVMQAEIYFDSPIELQYEVQNSFINSETNPVDYNGMKIFSYGDHLLSSYNGSFTEHGIDGNIISDLTVAENNFLLFITDKDEVCITNLDNHHNYYDIDINSKKHLKITSFNYGYGDISAVQDSGQIIFIKNVQNEPDINYVANSLVLPENFFYVNLEQSENETAFSLNSLQKNGARLRIILQKDLYINDIKSLKEENIDASNIVSAAVLLNSDTTASELIFSGYEILNLDSNKTLTVQDSILGSSVFAFDYDSDGNLDFSYIDKKGNFRIYTADFSLLHHSLIEINDVADEELSWSGISGKPVLLRDDSDISIALSNSQFKLDLFSLNDIDNYSSFNLEKKPLFSPFVNDNYFYVMDELGSIYRLDTASAVSEAAYSGEAGTFGYNTHLYNNFETYETPELLIPEEDLIIYPNPMKNSRGNIRFTLKEDASLSVSLYDINGEEVYSESSDFTKGKNREFIIDITDISSGVYIIKIEALGKNGESAAFIKKAAVVK